MAGTLSHVQRFAKQVHYSDDGKAHYELIPVEGDWDFISWSTWEAMKQYGQTLGIASDVWPEFEEGDFDTPTDEIEQKNETLRAALSRLTRDDERGHYLLSRICDYVRAGETIFFS